MLFEELARMSGTSAKHFVGGDKSALRSISFDSLNLLIMFDFRLDSLDFVIVLS